MIDVATIIFGVACLGVLGMLVLKIGEVRSGKRSLISRMGESTDHHVHDAYDKVVYFIRHFNKRTAILFVQWIAYHILSWAREAYLWLRQKAHDHPPSRRVIDMVAGRNVVNKNGGASFYLKNLSADAKVGGEPGAVHGSIPDVVPMAPAFDEGVMDGGREEKVAENPEK